MTVTADLPADVLARLRAEADRHGVSIDPVIAELSRSLPTQNPPAKRTLSFIEIVSRHAEAEVTARLTRSSPKA
jgi:hypothetical protein